jgi:hypothetical protein
VPDITYTLNVDTTRLAGAMSEVRSQLNQGMAGGAAGIGMMPGYVGGAMSGLADFGGAAAMAGGMMMRGLQTMPTVQVPSYMDMAMSTQPHYGILNANASIASEWLNASYGPRALTRFAPPGVGATEYGRYLALEHARRLGEAPVEAGMAAAGAIGTFVAGDIGAMAGGGIAKLLGRGTIGQLAGVVGGALAAGGVADYFFDEASRERKLTRELGEIADARRGLPETTRRQLGGALADVARGLGVPEQGVADVFAGMSQMGMVPRTTDPEAFKAQVRKMFEDVHGIATELHTSMGRAMAVMKSMEHIGFRGTSGVMNLVGTAAAAGMGVSPMEVYGIGMAGANLGVQAQIGGRFGFDLFEQSLISATHSGLSREQMRMAGGVRGLTQTFATSALQNAFGGIGMMQMLGAPPGGPGLAGDFMGQMAAGAGEFDLNRVLALQVGGGEAIRGLGPRRVTEMFRSSIRGIAEMASPDDAVRQRLIARTMLMNQGMNQTQALAVATNIFDPHPETGGVAAGRAVRAAVSRLNQEHDVHGAAIPENLAEALPLVGGFARFLKDEARVMGRGVGMYEARRTQDIEHQYELRTGVLLHEPSEAGMREAQSGGVAGMRIPRGVPARSAAAITSMFGGSGSAADVIARAGVYERTLGQVSGDPRAGADAVGSAAAAAFIKHRSLVSNYLQAKRDGDAKKQKQLLGTMFKGVYDSKTGFKTASAAVGALDLMVAESQRVGVKDAELFGALGIGKGMDEMMLEHRAADIDERKKIAIAESHSRYGANDKIAEAVALSKVLPKTHGRDGKPVAEFNMSGGGDANVAWDRLLKTIAKIDQNQAIIASKLRGAGKN